MAAFNEVTTSQANSHQSIYHKEDRKYQVLQVHRDVWGIHRDAEYTTWRRKNKKGRKKNWQQNGRDKLPMPLQEKPRLPNPQCPQYLQDCAVEWSGSDTMLNQWTDEETRRKEKENSGKQKTFLFTYISSRIHHEIYLQLSNNRTAKILTIIQGSNYNLLQRKSRKL